MQEKGRKEIREGSKNQEIGYKKKKEGKKKEG